MATSNQTKMAPDYITLLQNPNKLPLQYRVIRSMFKIFGTVAPWPTWKFAAKIFFTPRTRKLRENEKEILDAGETKIIQLDELDLFVTSWGYGDKRVLLLHGWGGNRAQMTPLVKELVDNNYQVIAFDAPAHGESGGSRTNMAKIVEAIHLVNDTYGRLDYVIGHSFGGAALTVAIDRGLEVDKLITISTPSIMQRSVMKPFQSLLNLPDKVMRRINEKISQIMGQTLEEFSAVNLAKSQTIPLLIVQDRQDSVITKEDAIELNNNWKDSELYLTDGFGHRQILRENSVHLRIGHFLAS